MEGFALEAYNAVQGENGEMKVFNLGCALDHRFEGWFASSSDYDSQLERGLLDCPVCGDRAIRRLPSAPRLNLSSAPGSVESSAADGAAKSPPTPEQLQSAWLRMARQLIDSTEDVGDRFTEEARRIHYREVPERGIRGVASDEDRRSLAEEGIEVVSFPMPRSLKDPLQ
jgi:hypothetical protein